MGRKRNKGKKASQPDKSNHDYTLEELEQRVLFSADVADLFLYDPSFANQPANEALVDENLELIDTTSQAVRELIFVDTGVQDSQQLVDDLLKDRTDGRQVDVVVLDDLDGRDHVQLAVPPAVDDSHPAGADPRVDRVRPDGIG